jgi:hypothetical protein
MVKLLESVQNIAKEFMGRELTSDDMFLFHNMKRSVDLNLTLKNSSLDEKLIEILEELNDKGHIRYDLDNIVITKKFFAFMILMLENNK